MHAPQVVRDRRLAQRHCLAIPIRVRLWKSALPEEPSVSRNLSTRGAFFFTELPVQIGTVIELRLRMPGEISGETACEWRCTGHVVRIDGGSEGRTPVAVQFDCYEIARHAGHK